MAVVRHIEKYITRTRSNRLWQQHAKGHATVGERVRKFFLVLVAVLVDFGYIAISVLLHVNCDTKSIVALRLWVFEATLESRGCLIHISSEQYLQAHSLHATQSTQAVASSLAQQSHTMVGGCGLRRYRLD